MLLDCEIVSEIWSATDVVTFNNLPIYNIIINVFLIMSIKTNINIIIFPQISTKTNRCNPAVYPPWPPRRRLADKAPPAESSVPQKRGSNRPLWLADEQLVRRCLLSEKPSNCRRRPAVGVASNCPQ